MQAEIPLPLPVAILLIQPCLSSCGLEAKETQKDPRPNCQRQRNGTRGCELGSDCLTPGCRVTEGIRGSGVD